MPVKGLKDFAGGQVELVQDDPMALAHCSHQGALAKHQAAMLIGYVAAQVLLEVGLLVVVDAHAAVPRLCGQVRHQAGLAG